MLFIAAADLRCIFNLNLIASTEIRVARIRVRSYIVESNVVVTQISLARSLVVDSPVLSLYG